MSTPYPKWTPPPVVNDLELHSSFEAEEQYVREMEKEADEELKNIIDSEQRQLEDLAESDGT